MTRNYYKLWIITNVSFSSLQTKSRRFDKKIIKNADYLSTRWKKFRYFRQGSDQTGFLLFLSFSVQLFFKPVRCDRFYRTSTDNVPWWTPVLPISLFKLELTKLTNWNWVFVLYCRVIGQFWTLIREVFCMVRRVYFATRENGLELMILSPASTYSFNVGNILSKTIGYSFLIK